MIKPVNQPAPRKPQQVWLFRGIAISIPLLLLLILELTLRIFHYGYDTMLFVEYPVNKDYWVLNPDASKRYFTDQLNATTGNREPFRKLKQPNTLRLFVLGESTTIGYPYFHNGSFHRWLAYRLLRDYPGKDVEIVNVSLTAVNSYTVRGFAQEVVNYQPDAVLIYTGHNEYYGALGVGSTNRLGRSPWLVNTLLWLRQFRFVQLLTRTASGIAGLVSSPGVRSGKTRMELMVGEQQIPYGSTLYNRGIDQFRTNMEVTLDLFHRQHVPVFLSNIVSNEKDLRPFISLPVDDLRFPGFRQPYTLGLNALEQDDRAAAYRYFKQAVDSCTTNALCYYYLGGLSYEQGNFPGAKTWYDQARAQDALRFRAPDSINSIINELCRKYDNTHLVDARSAFESASGHGIVGHELLLEHVHPNLAGYALLSDVFFKALQSQGLFADATATANAATANVAANELTFPQLLRDMPITTVDSLTGAYRVYNLRNNWPFSNISPSSAPASSPSAATPSTAPETVIPTRIRDSLKVSSVEEQLAYAIAFEHLPWEEAMSRLCDYYTRTGNWQKAATVTAAMSLEHPDQLAWCQRTAVLYNKARGLAIDTASRRYLSTLTDFYLDITNKKSPHQ